MESWDDLKYALAVYRYGGLSGAARALGVNHSTVSRRLSALEDNMGVRLFDRLPQGLKATIYGERAIESAIAIERQVMDLSLSIASKDQGLAGPLKVSAPQLIIQVHLAEIFAQFSQAYPEVELSIIATTDAVNLHRREADVSIRATNQPEDTLWGRKVLSQNRMYYGAKAYLAGRGDAEVMDCLNFMWGGDDAPPEVLKIYPKARVAAKFDDMVAVLGAVSARMGIARMPCFLGDSMAGFERVQGLEPQAYSDIWILTHPDFKKVPRIKTFMRFVGDALKERQGLFLGSVYAKKNNFLAIMYLFVTFI
jgi:DNA-binding transcriptional LysR family regulator